METGNQLAISVNLKQPLVSFDQHLHVDIRRSGQHIPKINKLSKSHPDLCNRQFHPGFEGPDLAFIVLHHPDINACLFIIKNGQAKHSIHLKQVIEATNSRSTHLPERLSSGVENHYLAACALMLLHVPMQATTEQGGQGEYQCLRIWAPYVPRLMARAYCEYVGATFTFIMHDLRG